MPKLSIIIPIYNAEEYLQKCLNSIKCQTLTEWECILINDGSTDNSKNICDNFISLDKRFKLIDQQNLGVATSRNIGIAKAIGDWITFVDSDDWIEPNRFMEMIYFGESKNIDIVQTDINVWKNNKIFQVWGLPEEKVYDFEDKEVLSNTNFDIGHCWDKIYKSSLLKSNKLSFENIDLFEDLIFNIKAFEISKKILNIKDKSYNYNIHNNSLAHSEIDVERKLSIIKTMDKVLSDMKGSVDYKNMVKNFMEGALQSKCPDMIDYVFPFVNGSDPEWQVQFNKFCSSTITPEINGKERYQSYTELLKYKFRALEKWMSDFGVIHIIVMSDSQLPLWLDTTKVHVVYHKDIIPDRYLPTFNSCTIEMFLQNILGLSEKFIYSNDDVYPNYKLSPSHYFEDNKLKSDFYLRKFYSKDSINKVWAKIPINSIGLAAKDKPEYKNKYAKGNELWELQHIGKPMFRSINRKVYELYKKEIEESITPFRNEKNINQYIFTSYALFHDRGIFTTFRFYVNTVSDNSIGDICKNINEPNENGRVRAICCNDGVNATTDNYRKLYICFDKQYPDKSKYEI